MLVELHMLKSFPPTNLNRDESGSPKSCFFGGCQRGRISSQSLKHSWRNDSELQKLPLGVRTRRLPDIIADRLADKGITRELIETVKPMLTSFGNKDAKEVEEGTTAQIMFFSSEDLDAITREVSALLKAVAGVNEAKKISVKQLQDVLKGEVRQCSVDMALFGRMITDVAFKNIEASMQVAHAISTHVVNMESDFYTAVDDLQRTYGEDAGSAMMGDTDYNSSCYYFYASLDTDQLKANLSGIDNEEEILRVLLPRLVSAIVLSNPSGKQNTFAGHALPGVVCVQLKERKVPVSHANAFEKPVRSREGYVKPSAEALAKHIDLYDKCFDIPVVERLWFAPEADCAPHNCTKIETLPQLLDGVGAWLKEG